MMCMILMSIADSYLTISDYIYTFMTMVRVNTSQFKAQMGKYLQAVRQGQELVVMDRLTHVARVLPMSNPVPPPERLVCVAKDPAAPALGKLHIKPIRPRATNSTEVLRADRERR